MDQDVSRLSGGVGQKGWTQGGAVDGKGRGGGYTTVGWVSRSILPQQAVMFARVSDVYK